MWKLALCGAMLVAWSLPAAAARDDRGDRYERQDRHQRHETRREVRVQELAHRLQDTAQQLEARVDRRNDRRHRRDRGLTRAVHHLDEAARRFHRTVERNDVDSRRANRRFEELHHAYRRAAARADHQRVGKRVRDDLDRIGSLVDRIQVRYARHDRRPQRTAWSVSWSY